MDKERVKAGINNALPWFAASAIQIPFVIGNGQLVNGALFLVNAGLGCWFYKTGVLKYEYKKLTESPIYKELLDLYKEFVKDVANMYKGLGIDEGIASAVAYKMCLEYGIFSATGEYKYTLFENDPDKFVELMGARVTTGKCCCRHDASFYSDIVNSMGGLSPKISVFYDSLPNKKLVLNPNHVVSGIIHKNKRIVFDPTVDIENMFLGGFIYDRGENASVRRVFEDGVGNKYTVVSGRYDNGLGHSETYNNFMKYTPITRNGDIFDDYMEAVVTNAQYMRDFHDFHEEEKPKILQLSYLSRIVSPYGKEIVREEQA